MNSLNLARSLADVQSGVILASVEIAAPVERVFAALTRPEKITRWWGKEGVYKTESWSSDFRVGGKWQADGSNADGTTFSVSGTYLEIDPPRTIVQTWKSSWDGDNETRLSYRLVQIDSGTEVTLRHEGFIGRPSSCEGHSQGWELILNWLANYLTHVN